MKIGYPDTMNQQQMSPLKNTSFSSTEEEEEEEDGPGFISVRNIPLVGGVLSKALGADKIEKGIKNLFKKK
tara:strand:- start:63 stop:275 length:213 start_codon:yes stop_codon:yes gene_type:complete